VVFYFTQIPVDGWNYILGQETIQGINSSLPWTKAADKAWSKEVRLHILVKDFDQYSQQREFKIIWKRNDNRLIEKAFKLRCPKALEYCSVHF
jgi:hypothetical protein